MAKLIDQPSIKKTAPAAPEHLVGDWSDALLAFEVTGDLSTVDDISTFIAELIRWPREIQVRDAGTAKRPRISS